MPIQNNPNPTAYLDVDLGKPNHNYCTSLDLIVISLRSIELSLATHIQSYYNYCKTVSFPIENYFLESVEDNIFSKYRDFAKRRIEFFTDSSYSE